MHITWHWKSSVRLPTLVLRPASGKLSPRFQVHVSERCTRLLSAAAVICTLVSGGTVHGWYFPEHSELSRLALEDHAPSQVLDVLSKIVSVAGRELRLCPSPSIALSAIPLKSTSAIGQYFRPYSDCVSYTALVALAGDHASDVAELIRQLTYIRRGSATIAALAVAAAQTEWNDFQQSADPGVARIWASTPLGNSPTDQSFQSLSGPTNPRDLVRDLDARLLFVDHDYTSRAKGNLSHFQDTTTSLAELLRRMSHQGDSNNALAQMVAHHLRSMRVARMAQTDPQLWREALLEHAFALHFLQDGFAAGHIANDPGIGKSTNRLQRHDYFSRHGLSVGRAIGTQRCVPSAEPENMALGDLPSCWHARGDGFASIVDRVHVTEATARIQLQFAMAVDSTLADRIALSAADDRCHDWVGEEVAQSVRKMIAQDRVAKTETKLLSTNTELMALLLAVKPADVQPTPPSTKRCDLWRAAHLLDPQPAWVMPTNKPWRDEYSRTRALVILLAAKRAIEGIKVNKELPPSLTSDAGAGSQPIDPLLIVGDPLSFCDPPPTDSLFRAICSSQAIKDDAAADAIATAQMDSSAGAALLIRAILLSWPGPQVDVTTIEGQDAFGRGLAVQVVMGANATFWNNGTPTTNDSFSFALGVGGGVAYRLDAVQPGREGRAIIEANLGLATSVQTDFPPARFLPVLFAELRFPLFTAFMALIGYGTQSSGWVNILSTRYGVGFYGARVLVPLLGTPKFGGMDFEVLYMTPFRPKVNRPAQTGALSDLEIRGRVGWIDHRFNPTGVDVITVGIELASGLSWFLP